MIVLMIAAAGSACAAIDTTSSRAAPTTANDHGGLPSATGTIDRSGNDGPTGFETRSAVLTTAEGRACELCVWLADTPDRHTQGLMGVTGLGGADAMAFIYERPTNSAFWMKDTVIPLEIMFVDTDGQPVGHRVMEPCTSEPCELYEPDAEYVVAVEFGRDLAAELDLVNARSFRLGNAPCRIRLDASG